MNLFLAEPYLRITSLVLSKSGHQIIEFDVLVVPSPGMREYGIFRDVVLKIRGEAKLTTLVSLEKPHNGKFELETRPGLLLEEE